MGYSPLHFACMVENATAINVLGTRQADLHLQGPSGFTGLHILAQSETSLGCIDTLLRLGASVSVYDEVCATTLTQACTVVLRFSCAVGCRRNGRQLISRVSAGRGVS